MEDFEKVGFQGTLTHQNYRVYRTNGLLFEETHESIQEPFDAD